MWAVASLSLLDPIGDTLDTLAIVLHPVLTFAAFILGALSLGAIRESNGRLKGRFIAATGITLGVLSFIFFLARFDRRPPESNESAAVANLRTINTAQFQYHSTHGSYGRLEDLVAAELLDYRFQSIVSGYRYEITLTPAGYTVTTAPAYRRAGRGSFFSTEDAIVRYPKDPAKAPPGMAGQPLQ
jgi:hypothetical protein